MAKGSNGYSVRSLERALSILECFGVDNPQWKLADLSSETGLHKATVFRLVKTLEAKGFLSLEGETNGYRAGRALLRLGLLARSQDELVRLARPYLERLAESTGETTDLAIWSGNGILFIDQVLTSQPFKPQARVGRQFQDFKNSHAKIMIAFGVAQPETEAPSSEEERVRPPEEALPDTPLAPEEIEEIREYGAAFDIGEHTLGICAVSAPVRDAGGEVVASISIVAPDQRFDPDSRDEYVSALKDVALALSQDLGWRREDPTI